MNILVEHRAENGSLIWIASTMLRDTRGLLTEVRGMGWTLLEALRNCGEEIERTSRRPNDETGFNGLRAP